MKNLFLYISLFVGAIAFAAQPLFFGQNTAAGAAPVTYVSQAQGSGTPGNQYEPDYVLLAAPVVVSVGGTCTSIEMYVSAAGAGNAKFALYDAAGTRVYVSGAIAIAATTGYKGVTGLSVAVTAQTYKVGMIDDGANMGWEVNTLGPAQYGNGDGTYAAGPPATFPANNAAPSGQPTVRMVVQ